MNELNQQRTNIADTKAKSLIMKWHEKLGHSNEASLEEMLKKEIVRGMKTPLSAKLETCKVCIMDKQSQTPFLNRQSKSKELLGIIHTDIC